ncbi:MAG: transporter [Haloarculaceae archaeon]
MALIDTALYAVHLLFGGVWTGSVVFATFAILPTARDGVANAEPLVPVVSKLRTLSRVSAVVVLATGGHMAAEAAGYTVASLTGTARGHLVLGMVALWVALIGLVEVGGGKLADGFDEMKVREPAREARPFFLAATVVSLLLLLDAGLLAGDFGV